jgi:hypothetical protein
MKFSCSFKKKFNIIVFFSLKKYENLANVENGELIFNICIYILTVRVVQLKSSSVESTIKQLAAGSNVQDCIPETKIKNFNFQFFFKTA